MDHVEAWLAHSDAVSTCGRLSQPIRQFPGRNIMKVTMPDGTCKTARLPDSAASSSPRTSPRQPESEANAAPNLALPWVIRLRYGMVFGGAATVAAIAYVLGFSPSFLWTLLPFGSVLVTNFWLDRVTHRAVRDPQTILGFVFAFDTVCLTAVLGLTGGPMNPFSLLYLVQITLAAIVLTKKWTWSLGGLSIGCFALLFFLHAPFAELHLSAVEPGFLPHLIGMWIAFLVAVALISFLTTRVSDALRLREQEVLSLQEHIARQERLTSLVTLAAGAAHELGTPLGTIAVVARELERYALTLTGGDTLCEDARLIRSQVERCRRILQRMSVNGAEPAGESPQTVRVGELFRKALDELAEPQRHHVSLDSADAGTPLFLPVRATVQSLVALVGNALDAGADDVQVILRAQCRASEIVFSISDNGRGMSEEILRRIAEPFFTTKEPGQGMGLGTFLVRTFAKRLGGDLTYESAPGHGTTATLTLPVRLTSQESGNVSV